MDARSRRFASQFTRLLAACSALFLVGCDVKIVNRTPPSFSENPSQTYTITAEVRLPSPAIRKESVRASVVIDGQAHQMSRSPLGENIYEYDYHLPAGRSDGAYYLLASFDVEMSSGVVPREIFTPLQHFTVVNRYGLSLDASRAPVGAEVTVLGRGFTAQDTVYVGGQSAQTIFRSPNSVSFVVPPLASGRNYPVSVGAPGAGIEVGTLRIDEGTLSVTPSALSVTAGERALLVFTIPTEAPAGGLLLDVTTDVPASVIMPEVTMPAGARSVNVAIQGGQPGSGSLFVSAPGFGEVTIPISVNSR